LPAAADYSLQQGKTTPVTLRIENHNRVPSSTMRLKAVHHNDWQRLQLGPGITVVSSDDKQTLWEISPIEANGTLELTLQATLADHAPLGNPGHVFVTLWKADENPGSQAATTPDTEQLPTAAWRAWETDFTIRPATPETARKPTDLEWHLVDARRGSTKNELHLKITNTSENEPLTNVRVYGFSMRGLTKVGRTVADESAQVSGVKGST